MLTYTQSHWSQPAPSIPGGEWGDTGFPAVDSSWAQPSRIAAIRLSRTIGTTAVNDFQFSYSGNRIYITTGGTDPGLSQQIYAALTPTYPLSGKLRERISRHPSSGGPAATAPCGMQLPGTIGWIAIPGRTTTARWSASINLSSAPCSPTMSRTSQTMATSTNRLPSGGILVPAPRPRHPATTAATPLGGLPAQPAGNAIAEHSA